jgi:2-dehydro-3-deoxygluconokinase
MLDQTDTLDMSYSGTGVEYLIWFGKKWGTDEFAYSITRKSSWSCSAAASIRKLGVQDNHLIFFKGSHIGTYLLEMGYGNRPSQVTYLNRSESVFVRLKFQIVR